MRSPGLLLIVAWYGLLAALLLRRRGGGGVVACLAAAVALCGAPSWHRPQPLLLHVMDADGGLIVHVDAGRKDHILINTGSAHQVRQLERHLRAEGVNRLRAVLLTSHRDRDAGGLSELVSHVPVDEVWLPPVAEGEAPAWDGVPAGELARGVGGYWRDGTGWEVLAPPRRQAYEDPVAAGPLIRIGRDGLGVLAVGGWDLVKARELAAAPVDARAPVVVWADRRIPRPEDLRLERIDPAYFIFSVKSFRGWGDDYEPLLRYLDGKAVVLRTDRNGGMVLRSRPAGAGLGDPGFEVRHLDTFGP